MLCVSMCVCVCVYVYVVLDVWPFVLTLFFLVSFYLVFLTTPRVGACLAVWSVGNIRNHHLLRCCATTGRSIHISHCIRCGHPSSHGISTLYSSNPGYCQHCGSDWSVGPVHHHSVPCTRGLVRDIASRNRKESVHVPTVLLYCCGTPIGSQDGRAHPTDTHQIAEASAEHIDQGASANTLY